MNGVSNAGPNNIAAGYRGSTSRNLPGFLVMGGRRFLRPASNQEKGGAGHLTTDDSTALLTEVDRLMLFILFLFQV
jgi:hypothetical protein